MTVANDSISVIVHPISGECECNGLTKREYFAAMAMQGLLVSYIEHGDDCNNHYPDVSQKAIMAADSLIEALNKQV